VLRFEKIATNPTAAAGGAGGKGGANPITWSDQKEVDRFTNDLHDARERLQDQLDFAIRLLDISPTPLFAKDTQHRFIEVNRAWLDMTGLPRAPHGA
jgi:PAS domain-containing protein